MQDTIYISGRYVIDAVDVRTGRVIWRKNVKNQLTAINQQVRTQLLTGTYSGAGLQIKYFAFGDDPTPALPTQTQLGNELYRKQITNIAFTDSTVTTILSLNTSEALFRIREIGVFCGADATSTANSGIMISRVVVDIDHNSNIVLNITRIDACALD